MNRRWRKLREYRQAARRPLIALFGLFGSGNTGNDASLEAMLATVERLRPEARLLCVCGEPPNIVRDFGVPAVPIHLGHSKNPILQKLGTFRGAIRALRGCELFIVPGTGALDDFGTGWTGLPLTLFMWCLAARIRRASIAFVSIGAGPIRHPLSRRLMKAAIGMAAYRSYRDQLSKDFLQGIGFPAALDPVYPDLAFLLPVPADPKNGVRRSKQLTVGLGVMTYQGWRNDPSRGTASYTEYLKKITRFALWLVASGHSIRLLQGDATDRRAIEDVQRLVTTQSPLLPDECIQAAPCHTLHDLMQQIAETDVVVATRYHNVVCALKLGRPVISIGYAEKNDALMAGVGLDRFCQAIETLDVDRLIRQFTELTADADILRRWLRTVQPTYLVRLRDQENVLDARLPRRAA
jgi:polysaccharide pyruvyl transferase WcaK-like protein